MLPERAQPRMCRCRGQAHQMRRGLRCGCRRRQQSYQAGSSLARGRRCARYLGERRTRDSSGCRILWRCCPTRPLEWRCLRSCSWDHRGPALLARYDPVQRLSFPVRAQCGPSCADLRTLGVTLLRAPSGGRCTKGTCRLRLRGPRGHPRFYRKVFWGTCWSSPVINV